MITDKRIRRIEKKLRMQTHEGMIPMYTMESLHDAYENKGSAQPDHWLEDTPANRALWEKGIQRAFERRQKTKQYKHWKETGELKYFEGDQEILDNY